jgi:hypothetical protein
MATGDGITRRDALVAAGTVGAVGAGALGVAGVLGLLSDDEAPVTTLVAQYTNGDVPLDDPDSSLWDGAPELPVQLLPQRVAPPFLDAAGVAELRARALHNGRTLAFRLAWDDPSADDLDSVDRYHDAVAIMLPTAPAAKPPPITMGSPGKPVHILQWRATWQRDLAGKSGVDQIHPRVEHDVMPDDVLPPETAALYWVGRAAGNPLSQAERTTPVEQVVAEGFGTTTHVADDSATGVGRHDDSGWAVTVGLPAARTEIGAPLEPGRPWQVAFAVWLGDQANRGGRKHYADWVPFELELP